jgi:hypothetical protein
MKLLNTLLASAKNFVRKHIVDSEEALWPNLTPMERAEDERKIKEADVRS